MNATSDAVTAYHAAKTRPPGFSLEEWQTRVDLAACYRLVAHFGMSDLIYNHITARVPGTDLLLINPYGSCTKRSRRPVC